MYLPDKVYCYQHPEAQLIDDYESGDIICPQCGLVVVDRMTNVIIDCASFTNENRKFISGQVGCSENSLLNSTTNLSTWVRQRRNCKRRNESQSKLISK